LISVLILGLLPVRQSYIEFIALRYRRARQVGEGTWILLSTSVVLGPLKVWTLATSWLLPGEA
jgi:hypothetical protein